MKDCENDGNFIFERLLERSGGFGRFQKLFLFLCIYSGILAAFNHLSAIYFTFTPSFTCLVSLDDNVTLTEPILAQSKSAKIDFFDSQCLAECESANFDQSTMQKSLVTVHNLICDRKFLLPIVTGSYMLGVVIFSLGSGILSDKFGRKNVLVILAFLLLISSSVAAIGFNHFWILLFSRFVVGGSAHNVWAVLFIISMETTVSKKRAFISGLINIAWNFGAILLAILAFWLKNAFFMQITFALMTIFIIFMLPMVPESPRWLVQHEKNEKALEIYLKMAKFNNVDAVDINHTFDALLELELHKKKDEEKDLQSSSLKKKLSVLWSYVRNSEIRRRFLLMLPPFLAVGTSSYGIHFTTKFLEGNLFMTAITKELFCLTWILILIETFGKMKRTNCLLLMFTLAGISAIIFFVLSAKLAIIVPNFIIIIVFGITQALIAGNYYLVDTYVPEIFSTDTRNLFFSLLETCSKMGTVLAPFIVEWGGSVHPGLPAFIFGCLMLISGSVFIFSPETKNQPLKQNVDELRNEKNSILNRLIGNDED